MYKLNNMYRSQIYPFLPEFCYIYCKNKDIITLSKLLPNILLEFEYSVRYISFSTNLVKKIRIPQCSMSEMIISLTPYFSNTHSNYCDYYYLGYSLSKYNIII